MTVANEKTTSRFNRNIKSNSYLVHYRSYQGAFKGKHVSFSTRRGLEDNIVLRFMKCLTPTLSFNLFTDNYLISFRLFVCLPTLELATFKQEACSTKISYANTLSSGSSRCKKWNVVTLNSAVHIKQKRCLTCVAG